MKIYIGGMVLAFAGSIATTAGYWVQDQVLTPDSLVPLGVAAALFVAGILLAVKAVRLWDGMSARITAMEKELRHIEKMLAKLLDDDEDDEDDDSSGARRLL